MTVPELKSPIYEVTSISRPSRAPWVHPRAGQPCGLGHWLVRRAGLGRVTGACVRPSLAVAEGHAPVYMAISTGRMRRRRRPRRVGARPAGVAALRCSDARLGFARGFGAGMTGWRRARPLGSLEGRGAAVRSTMGRVALDVCGPRLRKVEGWFAARADELRQAQLKRNHLTAA